MGFGFHRGVRLLGVCVLICALGGLTVGRAAGAGGQPRYVSSSGDDAFNDCTDPANPCATLQYTIDQSNLGDTIDVAGTLDANVTLRISLTITQWPGQAAAVLDGTSSDTVVTIDGT